MKKQVLYLLLFGLPMWLSAQVGIGTTSPSAQLHVVTEPSVVSERTGIALNLNSTSTAQQNTYSLALVNSSRPSLTASKYGIFNNVSGAGTATRYGIFSEIFKPNTGALTTDMFGVYSFIGQATGVDSNSYGFYADVSSAGNTGNIYGVYSIVDGTAANNDIYSGYFLGGKFSIGQTNADNYILPESRGTANQIMETDGAGVVDWVDKNDNSNLSLVRVNISANQNQAATGASWALIEFDDEVFDTNGNFNIATHTFTAPVDGYYRINASYHTEQQTNTNYYGIAIFVAGAVYAESTFNHHNVGDIVRQVDCLAYLTSGTAVQARVRAQSNAVVIDDFEGKTYLEIQQINRN